MYYKLVHAPSKPTPDTYNPSHPHKTFCSKPPTTSSHVQHPTPHQLKVAGLPPATTTMSSHSRLCKRTTERLCRARHLLLRRTNGPPAMRTRSRLAAKPAPPVAKANVTGPQTGTITPKTSTSRQLIASEKRLGRKRLQSKRVLETKKRDMVEKGKGVFGISQRLRLLTDMGQWVSWGAGF